MKLTVVVDNYCAKQGLIAEWGYSNWLETPDGPILLDTGGICHVLNHNLSFLKLNPANLKAVVLSHGHFDHISGLMDILVKNPNIQIVASPFIAIEKRGDGDGKRNSGGFPIDKLANFEAVSDYLEIVPNVYAFCVPCDHRRSRFVCTKNLWEIDSAGNLVADRFLDDLSLIIKSQKGFSLLLGCSHSGLPNILKRAQEIFQIDEFNTVIGGSHLCAVNPEEYPFWIEALKKFKVKHWRLNHCTGFKAAAQMAKYFDDVDWAGAGTTIAL